MFYYLLRNWIRIQDGKIAESDPNPDPTIADLDPTGSTMICMSTCLCIC